MICRGLYCDLYFVLMLLWKWWLWSCVYYCFIIIHIFFYKLLFTTREMLVIQWKKFYSRPSRWQSCIFIALFVQLAFLEGKKKKIQGGIMYYLFVYVYKYICIFFWQLLYLPAPLLIISRANISQMKRKNSVMRNVYMQEL